MKRIRNCVLVILCFAVCSQAQTKHSKEALSIGDSVPDIEYSNVLNYKQTSLRLSDFKDRLIILDLWSTWCTGCHRWFDKTDSLQQEFAGKVQFIMVNCIDGTLDSAKKIKAFFDRWNRNHAVPFRLVTAIEDTVTRWYFPPEYLPHYIWIRNRKLIATTTPDEVTSENIRAVLKGCPVSLPVSSGQKRFNQEPIKTH